MSSYAWLITSDSSRRVPIPSDIVIPAETEAYIGSVSVKMKNQEFMAKAPTKVREEMERKYGEAHAKLVALKERAENLLGASTT